MANFVSPGVYVIEKDISDYTPAVNPTVVGVVGFATKGPVNKPTLITSQENLVKTFGRPSDDLPGQAIEGALEILETANQNYFIRACDTDSATQALQAVGHVALGSCPALKVNWDGTAPLSMTVQVKNEFGINQYQAPGRTITVPIVDAATPGSPQAVEIAAAVVSVVGGELDADKIGAYLNSAGTEVWMVGTYAGALAKLTITTGTGGQMQVVGADGDAATNTELTNTATGITFKTGTNDNGLCYHVTSLYPGTGYNNETLPNGSIQGNSIAVNSLGSKSVTLNVNEAGVAEEAFKVSLLAGNFIENVINTGTDDLRSQYISGQLYHANAPAAFDPFTSNLIFSDKLDDYIAGDIHAVGGSTGVKPRFVKIVGGTSPLDGGTDGIPATPGGEANVLIGIEGTSGRTGMKALIDELAPITIAIVPGITDENVQNNLITLAENSGDFLAVIGTPVGYSLDQALAFTNGADDARSSPLNSSYAAIYYPWLKVFQPYLGKDIWLDPAVFGVRQMGYTDTVADLWFAPAGFVRGRLTKPVDTEVDLNQGDRDSMYSGGNVLNPIVKFPQQGITIFGQRTTQREATALDRINVRRLMVYIKRVIKVSTTRFVFEPNDKITQERVQNLLVPLFEDIKRRRGITEFKVVCDETVNTPVRVDRNELWCKVLIKPTKTAEVLVFELNITNQSADIG